VVRPTKQGERDGRTYTESTRWTRQNAIAKKAWLDMSDLFQSSSFLLGPQILSLTDRRSIPLSRPVTARSQKPQCSYFRPRLSDQLRIFRTFWQAQHKKPVCFLRQVRNRDSGEDVGFRFSVGRRRTAFANLSIQHPTNHPLLDTRWLR